MGGLAKSLARMLRQYLLMKCEINDIDNLEASYRRGRRSIPRNDWERCQKCA
jgi:hypothetical protein